MMLLQKKYKPQIGHGSTKIIPGLPGSMVVGLSMGNGVLDTLDHLTLNVFGVVNLLSKSCYGLFQS